MKVTLTKGQAIATESQLADALLHAEETRKGVSAALDHLDVLVQVLALDMFHKDLSLVRERVASANSNVNIAKMKIEQVRKEFRCGEYE